MTVSAFFDESGKFQDHKIVCLGGVSEFESDFRHYFTPEWGRLLHLNGLKELSAKHVLNPKRPLSKKNLDVGLERRISALLPFISCIRKNVQVVLGVAIDTRAFKKLPSHFHQYFGNKPSYWTPDNDRISLICDEDEEIAIPFYQLYTQVKREWPQAKNKLAAISFADDSVVYGLQAADFVSSLIRQEEQRKLKRTAYDYRPLYEALRKDPDKSEKLWAVGVVTGDSDTLDRTSKELLKLWKKRQEMIREEQQLKARNRK